MTEMETTTETKTETKTADTELAGDLATNGARMTPVAFEGKVIKWFQANGKRLTTFAGSEEQAKQIVAGLFYAASANPKLMQCTVESLGNCLMQSAQLSLFPGATQECAYLPFKKGKSGNVKEAVFVPMYQGLVKLAYNTGSIKSVHADVVYENDQFECVKGTENYLKHTPFLGSDRGEMKCVYCTINTVYGSVFEVESIAWVNERKAKAPGSGSKDSPWNVWWEEMAKKTLFKATAKWVPKDSRLAQAIQVDNEAESMDPKRRRRKVEFSPVSEIL